MEKLGVRAHCGRIPHVIKINDIESLLYNFEETYAKFKPLAETLEEFRTYIENMGSGVLKVSR